MRHGHQALMHAVRRANPVEGIVREPTSPSALRRRQANRKEGRRNSPYWSVLQEARSTERSELLLGHAQRGTTRADVACKAERFGSSREVGRVGVDGLRRAALEQGGRVQVVQSSGLVHHPVELGLRVGKHPGLKKPKRDEKCSRERNTASQRKTEGGRRKTEDRTRTTNDRRQTTEDKRQKTKDRRQTTEDKGQKQRVTGVTDQTLKHETRGKARRGNARSNKLTGA
eukprot:scaffold2771_cov252-Pinguiococcus_pyrenoidosus.AAC.45